MYTGGESVLLSKLPNVMDPAHLESVDVHWGESVLLSKLPNVMDPAHLESVDVHWG